MSDAVAIMLFCLALLTPVVLVVALIEVWHRKHGPTRRNRGNVSVSDTMNDISNAID